MITLRMLLVIVSATASGSFLIPAGSLSIAPAPSFDDQLDEPGVLEVGDDLGGVGLDVGVEQERMPASYCLKSTSSPAPSLTSSRTAA